tara:strand:+ start:395 stop:853 length:459 start_codon:yes stop_codon:yes gene_type:complete
MRPIPVLLLAALCACTPQEDAPAPSETAPAVTDTAPDQPRAQPSISLAGEWRLAGLDGGEFNESYGIALSADEGEIWWNPRCAGAVVRYRIVGDRFVVVEDPPPPPVACAIAVPQRLPEVMNAIRAADRIERTPANGIRLSGGGRSVTLFGQ